MSNQTSVPPRTSQPKLPPPQWRWVSKEHAKDLVSDASSENRRIKPSVVKEYIRLMNGGLWRLSPHGICLGRDGRSADGNHRLTALAASNLPGLWFLVCDWDVLASDLRVDRGSGRSLADFCRIEMSDNAVLTSIASVLSIGGANRRDPDEMRPLVTSFMPYITMLKTACNTMRKGRSTGPVRLGFIAKIIESTDERAPELCAQYRELVLNGGGQWNAVRILGNQLDLRSLNIHEIAGKTYNALSNPSMNKVIYKSEDMATVRTLLRDAMFYACDK